ncbi:hypothetical protein THMIRHAS_11270 [Thiosulfatimonas sediminis]|uniref:Phasin domain-containing protein n=1 Tax=Thiosulfatimonas sediminis TaxID=2675054 RepID=A0A6F8PUR0_9GAMM|nr:hypothetical protein [Thiosulfatimonas sediminis]BBP45754.1 hypothetical protein THMIRHAS_11270 [Thiosulfatimonas sediminis]
MMQKSTKNPLLPLMLFGFMVVAPMSVQADWLDSAKQTAQESWETTKETVSQWTQQAKESQTMQSVKSGTQEVVETVSDKQTYLDAWQATKEGAQVAKQKVVQAYEEAKTTNDTPSAD